MPSMRTGPATRSLPSWPGARPRALPARQVRPRGRQGRERRAPMLLDTAAVRGPVRERALLRGARPDVQGHGRSGITGRAPDVRLGDGAVPPVPGRRRPYLLPPHRPEGQREDRDARQLLCRGRRGGDLRRRRGDQEGIPHLGPPGRRRGASSRAGGRRGVRRPGLDDPRMGHPGRGVRGQGTKDHLRTAIQHLSSPRRRRIFRHSGWVEIQGEPVFLFQGGAVGAKDVEVDLPPPLDRFQFPHRRGRPSGGRRLVPPSARLRPHRGHGAPAGRRVSLPGGDHPEPRRHRLAHGSSGSMKSTLSALAQQHFGDFDRKTLSATWTSTDNSLEHRLFVLKDVLSVIDDYAPQADPRAQRDLDRRGAADPAERGQSSQPGTVDLRARPASGSSPRGFLLCNGELMPPGLSINARLVPVEVDRRKLDLAVITALQENGDRLRHAMRGYIEWLLPAAGDLRVEFPGRGRTCDVTCSGEPPTSASRRRWPTCTSESICSSSSPRERAQSTLQRRTTFAAAPRAPSGACQRGSRRRWPTSIPRRCSWRRCPPFSPRGA